MVAKNGLRYTRLVYTCSTRMDAEGGTTARLIKESDVKIPSIGYGLFGQSSDSQTNGGYDPDYNYGTTISLSTLVRLFPSRMGQDRSWMS